MDDESIRSALLAAAADEAAQEVRRGLCSALTLAFERAGESLRVFGHLLGNDRVRGVSPFGNGDDRLVGLGYLSQAAGSLVGAAAELVDGDNLYAAAALNRQLVEVEYLTWAFAEDQAEAASWLRSNRQERQQRWSPRHLRERSAGRFRSKDYSSHCDTGGHPTPEGFRTLFAGELAAVAELLVAETVTHGMSAWSYLVAAVRAICDEGGSDLEHVIAAEYIRAVDSAASNWRGIEKLNTAAAVIRTTIRRDPVVVSDLSASKSGRHGPDGLVE